MFCLTKKLRVPIGFSCNTSLPILEGEGERQSMTGTPISQWFSWLLSSEVFKAAPPQRVGSGRLKCTLRDVAAPDPTRTSGLKPAVAP